jgi:hypothetical protein
MNDVIDYGDFAFHPEGLNNFLEFGFSVLGQTPVRDVKFLPPSSKLTVNGKGTLQINPLPDPIDAYAHKTSHPHDVFHALQKSIRDWENTVSGEIVIPTSGGYDSRLLNYFIADRTRIRSFTYGISQAQNKSFEVVFAKLLSKKLKTQWTHVQLGDYHSYIDDWYDMFGASTHAHGMYHFEFYDKILSNVSGGNPFLSGIFGDVWAGSTELKEISSHTDLYNIGYTHGLHADPKQSKLKTEYELRKTFFEKNRKELNDPFYQTVWLIRLKIILISFLI